MKKSFSTTLALLLVTLLGTSMAQTLFTAESTADHQLDVVIPEVLFVRILGTTPTVTFDLTIDVDGYLVAADDGTPITSTSSTMTDVQVWANSGWALTVSAAEFLNAGSLVIANVGVNPRAGDADPSVTTLLGSFRLDEIESIAEGDATGGWASVGINGDDYEIYVDGSEAEGPHTTTVTYTITSL